MFKLSTMPHTTSYQWFSMALFLLLTPVFSTAQMVENVRTSFDQSKQLMFIYYDVKGLNYKKEIEIIPIIKSDTASAVNIKSLSGDYGWLKKGGKNKLVVWDPFKDGVNGLEGVQIELKTEVRGAAVQKFWYGCFQGSNSAPFGLKVARLNRIGFFGGFRVGQLPPSYRYTVSNTGVMDYTESGVYEIGTERRLASYAITAGPIFQLTRNVYAYAGFGYGLERLFWKYQAYNLDRNPIGKGEWALNESINRKGFMSDVGAMIRFGRVLIDLGMSGIGNSYQIIGGVGYSFSKNVKR